MSDQEREPLTRPLDLDESQEALDEYRRGVTYETPVAADEPLPPDPDGDGEEEQDG